MKINIKLKNARKKIGLTQVEVAKRTQIGERLYQSYEYGDFSPNVQTAIKLAEVLNSTVEKLFKENIS